MLPHARSLRNRVMDGPQASAVLCEPHRCRRRISNRWCHQPASWAARPGFTQGYTMPDKEQLTTAAGIPVPDNQNSISVGPNGPLLFAPDREERAFQPRARAGARGACEGRGRVRLLQGHGGRDEVDEGEDVLRRPGRSRRRSRGSPPWRARKVRRLERDPRGFALKFYTRGRQLRPGGQQHARVLRPRRAMPPTSFTARSAIRERTCASQRRCGTSGRLAGEFASGDHPVLRPWHAALVSSHERLAAHVQRINAAGERFWVKYHFKTKQGIQNFTREEAGRMRGEDPDHATRDLFEAIERGDAPGMARLRADHAGAGCPDLPHQPVRPDEGLAARRLSAGRVRRELVLDRNPQNYFAEIEQAAFEPASIVPGIGFSPDKMLQARIFSYADAHRYRIGTNYRSSSGEPPPCRRQQLPARRRDAQRRQRRPGRQLRAEQLRRPGREPGVEGKRRTGYELRVVSPRAGTIVKGNDDYTQAGQPVPAAAARRARAADR